MIKTSGYRVSPTEVEEVLYATQLVGECAAFGVAHPTLGQAIVVVVTPPRRRALDEPTLLGQCRDAHAGLHGAGAASTCATGPLPRNPNGKIDRKQLASEHADPAAGCRDVSATRHPSHDLVRFPVVDDELQVGGMPLTRSRQRVGRTPFYAYDRAS